MIPLNHKVEIEFGELMELIDKAKELEDLESRNCGNCKHYDGSHACKCENSIAFNAENRVYYDDCCKNDWEEK